MEEEFGVMGLRGKAGRVEDKGVGKGGGFGGRGWVVEKGEGSRIREKGVGQVWKKSLG